MRSALYVAYALRSVCALCRSNRAANFPARALEGTARHKHPTARRD
jgi:hypothetical protein